MAHLNVIIAGQDLLIEGMVSWLKQQPEIDIVASVSSPQEVLTVLERQPANALITFESTELSLEWLFSVRYRFPGLPIIYCNVAEDIIRVLRSWVFAADPQGLISALETLSQATDPFGFQDSSGGLS